MPLQKMLRTHAMPHTAMPCFLPPPSLHLSRRAQHGAGIVELMVSVVIGLVIVLALTRIAVDSDRQQRSSVGSGDVSDTANMASYLLRTSVMSAGHSINFPGAIRCPITIYREADDTSFSFPNASPPTPNPDPPGLLPVFIMQGTGTASDVITIASGSGRRFVEAGLFSSHDGSSDDFVTDSAFGFLRSDMVILSETGRPCAIRQLSADPPALPIPPGSLTAPAPTNLVHESGTEHTSFNNPSGIIHSGSTVAYTASAKVTSLGAGPPLGPGLSIHRFSVNGTNFQRLNMMTNTTDILFGNVMTFQAQYGFRTTTNTVQWCTGPGDASCANFTDDAAGWRRVHAIRFAMVIRNPQFENNQRDADGNCNSSPATLTWWDDDGTGSDSPLGSFDLSAVTDGRCYRHYVVETTVPLKNMIWNMEQ